MTDWKWKKMQKQLKQELIKKQHNTKFTAKKTQMNLARCWLTRFSDKHKHETDQEFIDWLEK